MKYISNFNKFFETMVANQPSVKPTTKPTTTPRPQKPGKIVRPSVDPAPKAEDVAKRFIALLKKDGENIEKYTK
jgi:hypothetical protein